MKGKKAQRWSCGARRGRILAVALLVALLAPAAFADENKDDYAEGSDMHTALTWKEKRDALAAQLEQRQGEVLALLGEAEAPDEALIEALKAQHQGWLKFRAEDCTLLGALTGGGGAWPTAYAFECEANATDRRQRLTATAVRCLKSMTPAQRETNSARCLKPLVSLTRVK